MNELRIAIITLLVAATTVGTAGAAIGEAEKCLAAKIKIVGKFEACLYKAESLAVLKETPPDNSKCFSKYADSWDKTELKYGLDCPTDGDSVSIESAATTHVDTIVTTLKNLPPACGNNNQEAGEQCDGTDLNGETCVTQGFDDGALACDVSCNFVQTDCAVHDCSLLDQTGCGVGQACYPVGKSEVCAGEGAGTEGQGCMFTNGCVAGQTCVNYGAGNVCAPFCDNIDNVPACAQICTNVPDWDTNVGYCHP